MLLIVISNGAYILFSFVAFIVYAFIYLSSVGVLDGRKENMQNRPAVAGYDSLRNCNQHIGEADRAEIESLANPTDSGDENGSAYDFEATFYGNQHINGQHTAEKESEVDDVADEPSESPVNISSTVEEESDEDDEWPTLGRPIECKYDDSSNELRLNHDIIGDLTAEELVLLTNIRATTLNDAERYPELVEECLAANDKVNDLVQQTGKSVEEIVSTRLSSNEKVIFNAFPMVQQKSVV